MTKNDFLSALTADLIESPLLYYVDGYKYQSRNDMIVKTFIYPKQDIVTDLIILRTDSWMWVSRYFAWDGCSGLAIDTDTNMRGGLFHDACAALMRMDKIPLECKLLSNDLIRRLMIEDGAFEFRAKVYELVLDKLEYWAKPSHSKKVRIAPHKYKLNDLSPA